MGRHKKTIDLGNSDDGFAASANQSSPMPLLQPPPLTRYGACYYCPLAKVFDESRLPKLVAPKRTVRLMIITLAPNKAEDEFLQSMLDKLGADKSQVYVAHCLRCPVTGNPDKADKQTIYTAWATCQYYWNEEMKWVKSYMELLLGEWPKVLIGQCKLPMRQVERLFITPHTIVAESLQTYIKNPKLEYRLMQAIYFASKYGFYRLRIKPSWMLLKMYGLNKRMKKRYGY